MRESALTATDLLLLTCLVDFGVFDLPLLVEDLDFDSQMVDENELS